MGMCAVIISLMNLKSRCINLTLFPCSKPVFALLLHKSHKHSAGSVGNLKQSDSVREMINTRTLEGPILVNILYSASKNHVI